METKHLLVIFFAFILLSSCSENEVTTLEAPSVSFDARSNWQESTLTNTFFENQKETSHYSFDKKEIVDALSIPNLIGFRFVLGLQADELQITMVGINHEGNEVVKISSEIYENSSIYDTPIQALKESPFTYAKSRINAPFVGEHLLSYASVYKYVSKWQNALDSGEIKNVITDKGVRYRYYSLEKEVIANMVAKNNVESIALFLGLNAQNKLTTVFLQKDVSNQLILNNSLLKNSENGEAFDFSEPCPNTCGTCKCANGVVQPCGKACADGSKPVPIDD